MESIYWLGVKVKEGLLDDSYYVSQWEPYELNSNTMADEAFKALYEYMSEKEFQHLRHQPK